MIGIILMHNRIKKIADEKMLNKIEIREEI